MEDKIKEEMEEMKQKGFKQWVKDNKKIVGPALVIGVILIAIIANAIK